jgi:hypothetical protein
MRRLRASRLPAAGILAALLLAAGPAAGGEGLEWGGELRGEMSLPAGEDFRFAGAGLDEGLLRLDLSLEAGVSERLRLFAEGAVEARGLPGSLATPDDLASPETLTPIGFELVEAYADVYGFLLPQLDLRAGRQRIVWGPAERVSVIDNVNPLDLSDPWDFGRRLASDAVRLKAYLWDLTLEAVYLPYFRPALLPADGSAAVSLPAGLPAAPLTLSVAAPGNGLGENATVGTRLSAKLGGWDLAASYLYGRTSLPTATQVTVLAIPAVEVELSYPRQHVLGLEAAGELFGIGIWGEAACYWPDYEVVTDTTAVGGGVSEERAKGYAKWVLGLDYTFGGGLYACLQYVHGFYNENARDALNDYLLLGVEWKLLRDRLKIGPLAVAWEVDDLGDVAGSWGLALVPEVSFYPVDAVQLTVGLRWLAGEEGTAFGSQEDAGELYFQAVFRF